MSSAQHRITRLINHLKPIQISNRKYNSANLYDLKKSGCLPKQIEELLLNKYSVNDYYIEYGVCISTK